MVKQLKLLACILQAELAYESKLLKKRIKTPFTNRLNVRIVTTFKLSNSTMMPLVLHSK